MLRNLRSRRRPPYGDYICAVIAALLLLLSVSLLYTRLSHSQPHARLHHSAFHELNTDFLVSDSGDEDASGTGSEDRIDELDVVDEGQQHQQEEELEEDDDGFDNQIKVSGYFFDHVSGSIRRAFSKRSIEDWDDEHVGFLGGSGLEDRSKAAFASDDTPVDEEVRRKATQVMGIEDALLLKLGRRLSPLREGWGDWFDKKGDFLRRDRMFKSNWGVLNPMNNPMLQDPDGVGITGLTRGDRIVQKWWMNEFQRTPFLGKKTMDISRMTRDSKLLENYNDVVVKDFNGKNGNADVFKSDRDSRSETKGAERRTLNDNASNGADYVGTVTQMSSSVHKNLDGNNVDAFNSDRESRSEINGAEHRTLNENMGNGNMDDGVTLIKLSDDRDKILDESVDDGSTEKDTNASGDLTSAKRNSGTQKYLVSEEHGSGARKGNSVDHVGELDRSSGLKDIASEIQRRPEFLNHIYADGKRWGFYPGLPPHLAFTEFMDAFFRMGKCDMRVFMVWNSPPWMYGVRHQRGLESLLFHHRDACVVVFSETIELDFFKDDFVNHGYKVAVAMPNLDELLKDTPTYIFSSVWFEWKKTKFYSTHYSELVRLAVLYKYGGIYLDSDIIVLKPISSLNNSVGMEDHDAGSALNGAVMAFERHSIFIKECLKEFYSTYDDTRLRWNGADLLTRVARNFLGDRDKYVKQLELKVEPANIFFPISSQNITRYFTAPATETEKAQQDALLEKILHESLTFHFWNSLTSSLIPEPESLVTRLINNPCIRCWELL